jgi:hypothetical protein
MAITSFGKGRETEPDLPPRASAAPAGTAAGPGGLTAFIDQGSEFEGKLSFRDTVRIDGRFRGEIASENTLIVGESGEIEATISSNTVAISGTVTGDVIAKHKELKMPSSGGKKSGSGPLKAVSGVDDAGEDKLPKP